MNTLLGILFIILIIGLIKPKLILRWDEKPNRLKIFLYWFFVSLIISYINGAYFLSDEIKIEDSINTQSNIKKNVEKSKDYNQSFNINDFENQYSIELFDEEITDMGVIKAEIASRYYFKETVKIKKDDIEMYLREKLKILDKRTGFKHFNDASNIIIWLYQSKDHAKEKGAKWICMISKSGENRKSIFSLSDERYSYFINPTNEVIHDLDEEKRKEIYRAISYIAEEALSDADKKFPNANDWEDHYDYEVKREKKYMKKLIKHYQIENKVSNSILIEGIKKGWLEKTGEISFSL